MSSPVTWQSCLHDDFGFASLRHQQQAIVERTLRHQSSLVLMPTGGGKSLCFQLPALVFRRSWDRNPIGHPPLTIVLSPLIALMKDQVDALLQRGIQATFINSSLNREERDQRYAQIADGQHAILYVTPERFRKDRFWDALQKRSVPLLAVDEAHCISEWGHDFRPDYTRVGEIRSGLGNPTTLALTATATPDVQSDILVQLGLDSTSCHIFHDGIARPNLALHVHEVWGTDEKLEHIQLALTRWGLLPSPSPTSSSPTPPSNPTPTGSAIIYFTLIRTLMEFSERLDSEAIPHLCYHGDLDRGPRRAIQEQFMRSPSRVVLATNAFGMGIDKDSIRLVMHAELPGSLEAYFQEIGRAGRDGLPSECTLLYDQHDLQTQMEFLFWSNPDADFYQRVYHHLQYDADQVAAFGVEWLRSRLCDRKRQDRRLETALSLLERYAVLEGDGEHTPLRLTGPLPEMLSDPSIREQKLRRDQRKLFALVEYARATGHHADFLLQYFTGPLPPPADTLEIP